MNDETKVALPTAFEYSVDKFSHRNVNGSVNKEKIKMIPGLLIRSLLIAICIGMFGYAVLMLAMDAEEDQEIKVLHDSIRPDNKVSVLKPASPLLEPAPMYSLQEMFNSNGEHPNYVGNIDNVDDLERRSSYYWNYRSMASQYKDTFAWIYVDHTEIDYPVMKGPYTDYYLYRNFQGYDSLAGSIFADSNMSDTYSANVNNVIYGHCMRNGEMFRTLKTFMESANRNTLVQDMNIEIYSKEGLFIYEVLSAYRDDGVFFVQTIFANENQYSEFLDKIVSRNTLNISQDYDVTSRLVTLVTCANVSNNEDERYVMHGILKSFIPASQL